ncbi:DUF3644 domain-containing protein [Musicola paradisiaca]|uniref:DUF3644 domain-containing protein n=1 Tax=Musicola paradisiaca (strain Ech703) TaxID=579405 RepID=C6C390_MUSP7|nr:DUF3644 domain-containing protein [Musicola paradisiaca]ACS87188.1 hypothetical protein Dd703_3427 [Musicola paradisiaca Ech703]
MKINKSISALYIFLQDAEKNHKIFDEFDILKATGWKPATFKTYYGKGQLSEFISESGNSSFESSNTLSISLIEFAKQLSQSKHIIALGHNCKSKLAKALLKKSRDNMILALELYNRPSLENKMDAFVMCFCTAWEQFLKAKIIEKDGEKTIFKQTNKKGIKETISLRECLDRIYPVESKVRKNIEQIAYFRDQAVHLLMPEVQGIISRIFQSGVLNFTSHFEEFTEISFLKNSHVGMISLVGEFKSPPVAMMKSTYGNIADDILNLTSSLYNVMENNDDIEFAIPLNVKLVFVKDSEDGNSIILAKAEEGMEGLKKALVIKQAVDRSQTHPFLQKNAIKEINDRLHSRYSEDKLSKCLTSKNREGKYVINRNCFDSVICKNSWKNSNNKYHHKNENPEYHYYSIDLIEIFIQKIMEHEGYLVKAKESYNRRK